MTRSSDSDVTRVLGEQAQPDTVRTDAIGRAPTEAADDPPVRESGTIRRGQTGNARRYELGNEIARGGMGRVVEAKDTVLGRTVAIKEVLEVDDELVRRFERETQITARLEHPSIVPVHDAGRGPTGAPFYVMRKVSGRPLDKLIYAAQGLDERLALLPHVVATANALAHAHSRGVIHRDLKPTNVLVGELGETVVIDWGLAKVIDEPDDAVAHMVSPSGNKLAIEDSVKTRVGSVVGTPGFMAPEQLRGERVDARADVYALGATLYFLLSRRPPHAANTGDEMMERALAGPPQPVRELTPGVPPELATIVETALSPNLDIRYRDAAGFAKDLERFLAGQLVASHRYTRRERVVRWLRRNRVPVAVALVGVAALAVFGTISISRTIHERDRADRALVVTREQNEQLQLAHALTLVPTHPTGAVALARPLATKHWETARALAMAARARGVAFGLPASQFTRSLSMASDGIRVLSAGNDGVVRIHDLRARSSRVIAGLGGDSYATWAEHEQQIVAWTANKISVIPVAGGPLRQITLASEPHRLRAGTTRLTWCDKEGVVWTMPLATLEPQKIDTGGDPVDHLEVHGDSFALAGKQATFLLNGEGLRNVITGHARELAFSGTGHLAAIIDDYKNPLTVIELDPAGELVARMPFPDAYAIDWQENELWIGSERGLSTRAGLDTPVRGGVLELLAGPGQSLIGRTRSSAFTLFDTKTIAEIPPTYAIHDLATGPRSSFVAAGSDYVVLVWNLDDFRPRDVTLPAPATMMYADADQMIAIHGKDRATWIQLGSLEQMPLDLPGPVHAIVFAPDGSSALAITDSHSAVLFRRGAPGSILVGTGINSATFVSATQIAVGTDSGTVRIIDLAGALVRELLAGTSTVQAVETSGGWLAAHFKDTSLARTRLDGTMRATLPADGKLHWLEQFPDGDLVYTDFEKLRIWHPDGSVTEFPGLPTPVSSVEAIGPDSFIVYTGGDSAHLVELGGAHRTAAVYPPGTRMEWLRLEGDHGVYLSPDGSLYETSPRTGVNWRVATPRRERFLGPLLSRDRSRIYTLASDHLLVWGQTVPVDAKATAALFETLTNATPVESAADSLVAPAPTLRLRWK